MEPAIIKLSSRYDPASRHHGSGNPDLVRAVRHRPLCTRAASPTRLFRSSGSTAEIGIYAPQRWPEASLGICSREHSPPQIVGTEPRLLESRSLHRPIAQCRVSAAYAHRSKAVSCQMLRKRVSYRETRCSGAVPQPRATGQGAETTLPKQEDAEA